MLNAANTANPSAMCSNVLVRSDLVRLVWCGHRTRIRYFSESYGKAKSQHISSFFHNTHHIKHMRERILLNKRDNVVAEPGRRRHGAGLYLLATNI